jgi:Putative zinc-finger
MYCEDVRKLLSSYLDDVLSLPMRVPVDEHLRECPVCRAELVETKAISRSFARLPRPIPPPDLAAGISDAVMIEAAARAGSPHISLGRRLSLWLQPRLMPYSVGSFASVVLFVAMFAGLRPHFVALHEAALSANNATYAVRIGFGYDLNRPVTPEDFAAQRAPFAEQSPSLNPAGSLAALTRAYANPRAERNEDADDMVVVADVFSNGAASLAGVVHAPRDPQMLDDFEAALRRDAAFVPASMDRRPDTMRVVFAVQKVDVRERNF